MIQLLKSLHRWMVRKYRLHEMTRGYRFGKAMIKDIGHNAAADVHKANESGTWFDTGVHIALGLDTSAKFGIDTIILDKRTGKEIVRYLPRNPKGDRVVIPDED